MRIRQREFCHNCKKYVIYEFEDIIERQIIFCPNCGHQHYRELDEGTIVNIRMNGNYQPEICIAEELEKVPFSMNGDIATDIPIKIKKYKIIGYTADGRPIIEKTNELSDRSEQTKIMTEKRWGRDSSQI